MDRWLLETIRPCKTTLNLFQRKGAKEDKDAKMNTQASCSFAPLPALHLCLERLGCKLPPCASFACRLAIRTCQTRVRSMNWSHTPAMVVDDRNGRTLRPLLRNYVCTK